MKGLLSVALMVLVSLVGMVGFSRDAESLNDIPTMSAISNAVSTLQATANPTTGAVNELLETVYDLDTVYDWDTVYNWEKVYAMLDTGYDLDTVYDWETVYALEKVYARVPASAKMYYLTVASFTGGDAITACDSGFHMASISEMQDPSNLQYATRSTAAYDSLVDGQRLGPPTNYMGWVRTEAYPLTGFSDNCNFWQSSSDQQRGTTMSLYPILGDANPDLYASDPTTWWHKVQQMCSLPEPVWCVEDPA
jgi:hypothetical protein